MLNGTVPAINHAFYMCPDGAHIEHILLHIFIILNCSLLDILLDKCHLKQSLEVGFNFFSFELQCHAKYIFCIKIYFISISTLQRLKNLLFPLQMKNIHYVKVLSHIFLLNSTTNNNHIYAKDLDVTSVFIYLAVKIFTGIYHFILFFYISPYSTRIYTIILHYNNNNNKFFCTHNVREYLKT